MRQPPGGGRDSQCVERVFAAGADRRCRRPRPRRRGQDGANQRLWRAPRNLCRTPAGGGGHADEVCDACHGFEDAGTAPGRPGPVPNAARPGSPHRAGREGSRAGGHLRGHAHFPESRGMECRPGGAHRRRGEDHRFPAREGLRLGGRSGQGPGAGSADGHQFPEGTAMEDSGRDRSRPRNGSWSSNCACRRWWRRVRGHWPP